MFEKGDSSCLKVDDPSNVTMYRSQPILAQSRNKESIEITFSLDRPPKEPQAATKRREEREKEKCVFSPGIRACHVLFLGLSEERGTLKIK